MNIKYPVITILMLCIMIPILVIADSDNIKNKYIESEIDDSLYGLTTSMDRNEEIITDNVIYPIRSNSILYYIIFIVYLYHY